MLENQNNMDVHDVHEPVSIDSSRSSVAAGREEDEIEVGTHEYSTHMRTPAHC